MTARPSLEGHPPPPSRWRYLLPVIWVALGARLALALARGESVGDDFISLALVGFFTTTAVLGSRVWLWLSERRASFTGRRLGDLPEQRT